MDPDYHKRESIAVAAIKKQIPASLKKNMLKESKGLFAEIYHNDIFPNHYCVCSCDGVGTKLILAEAMDKYDTVGIDLVAMNANDLATLGAVSPFLFLNYLAVQHKIEEEGITGDIIKGIVKGLEQCDTSSIINKSITVQLGKGETASVDEMISGLKPGYGFDIAASMIGFIEKNKLKLTVNDGDSIIAFQSSGFHSNGYTDVRLKLLNGDFETRPEYKKNYTGRFSLTDKFEGKQIGEILLAPTRIYSQIVARVATKIPIVGVNNTGYGLKNMNRIQGNFEFAIDNPILQQPIFSLIQKEAKFTDEQMYQKFNMGMGFFIIVPKDRAQEAITLAKEGQIVGSVKKAKQPCTTIIVNKKKISYQGY